MLIQYERYLCFGLQSRGSPDPLLRRLIKTFFHPRGAVPNLHTEVMILWRHLLAAAPAFLSSRAERPFSPGALHRREVMAFSTSSSNGSAHELMTGYIMYCYEITGRIGPTQQSVNNCSYIVIIIRRIRIANVNHHGAHLQTPAATGHSNQIQIKSV